MNTEFGRKIEKVYISSIRENIDNIFYEIVFRFFFCYI